MEMKADCIIDKKYWFQALAIDRRIQRRNDIFLEHSLDRLVFSFKTNKRIFKGVFLLSVFNRERIGNFIDRNLVTSLPDREVIEKLHHESLDKVVDLFQNWKQSEVIGLSPSGIHEKENRLKAFLSAVG
jgi:hypothetical protein